MNRLLVLLVFIISGCSTVTKNMELATEGHAQTEVTLYRPSAFPAAANGMLVGLDEKYFVSLKNNQYVKIKINSGTYNFQVKANGSPASSLRINLEPNKKVCLKSNINPAVAGVAIVPLVANMVSWFQLSEVTCPDGDFFAKYFEVSGL
jgi:hypothetical protein